MSITSFLAKMGLSGLSVKRVFEREELTPSLLLRPNELRRSHSLVGRTHLAYPPKCGMTDRFRENP